MGAEWCSMVGAAARHGPGSSGECGARYAPVEQDASCVEQETPAVWAPSRGEMDASSTSWPTPRDMKDSGAACSPDSLEILRQALDVKPFVVEACEMIHLRPPEGRGSAPGARRSVRDGATIPRRAAATSMSTAKGWTLPMGG